MRDFRDAKAMAQSLRQALATKDHPVTHSEALELIAKAFNFDNWNILAAKIEPEQAPGTAPATAGPKTMYCSFCGKPQQEVAMLIAGPEVFICDECVELCDDIVEDRSLDKLENDAKARDQNVDTLAVVRERLAAMSTEQLGGRKRRTERWLHHIEWSLDQLIAGLEGRPREWVGKDPLAGKSPDQLRDQRSEWEARREQVRKRLQIAETILAERGEG